jgi:protein-S-isoprenylcysteine O-methyltransferase Ste14
VGEINPLLINAWLWIVLAAFWLIAAIFVYPTRTRESYFQRQRHLIPLYIGFFLIFHHRSTGPLNGMLYRSQIVRYAGDVITFFGVAFAIWARITLGRYWSGLVMLKEGHKLIRGGPYRLTRHPLYTGFVIGVFGSAIASAQIDGYLGFLIATASLIFKLRREETLLTGEFGEEYLRFKREVPAAVVPGIY